MFHAESFIRINELTEKTVLAVALPATKARETREVNEVFMLLQTNVSFQLCLKTVVLLSFYSPHFGLQTRRGT